MSDLVPYNDPDSWVHVLGPVGDLAGKIARTEFVPKGMQGNPAAVAAAILTGREMGLGPLTSLRGIHVVEGRPSLTAEMLAARILAAGHTIRWQQSTDTRATVRIERADGQAEAEATWTIQDAQRAGLAGRKVWQAYPRHMLRHRALTEAASMACPDVALGLDVGVTASADEVDRPTHTVVQINAEPELHEVVDVEPAGEPARVTDPTPEPEPTQALCTGAQLRKIGALIGELEKVEGRKMDRDERRRFIGWMAGVPDSDTLGSAKELTMEQASQAIGALTDAMLAAGEPPQPEPEAQIMPFPEQP